MSASVCVVFDCATCPHCSRGRCPGCEDGNVELIASGGEPCAIYQCVKSKDLSSCHECSDAVCPFSRDLEKVCPVRAHYEKKRCYVRKLSEHFLSRQYTDDGKATKISDKTVSRLRLYLFAVKDLLAVGFEKVSSNDISRKVGVRPWLIRRDLSQFGGFGRPSIGYDAAYLRDQLSEILHLGDTKQIIWVGASRLATEPSLTRRFDAHGFRIISVLDTNPSQCPKSVGDLPVQSITDSARVLREYPVACAVIAVPEEEAQSAAEILISAGVNCLLNLTSAVIVAPSHILIRNLDIVAELYALSYYCGRNAEELAQSDQIGIANK